MLYVNHVYHVFLPNGVATRIGAGVAAILCAGMSETSTVARIRHGVPE
jgi:hypothetical protein